MILTTFACIYSKICRIPLIVDRHTTFLLDKPFSNYFKRKFFLLLHSFTIKYASLTIVTNTHLAELVSQKGGNPFVLPDPLPSLPPAENSTVKNKQFRLIVPNSFSSDEPLDQIIAAAEILKKENIEFLITGNTKRMPAHIKTITLNNVIFTGYLPDQQYINLLLAVDAVLVLTTATSTMLCGCYEAISAEKPLITSDKPCLTNYFTEAVFVDNSPEEIATACKNIKNNTQQMITRTKIMKETLTLKWNQDLKKLEDMLHTIV